jgi:hypothetical protein
VTWVPNYTLTATGDVTARWKVPVVVEAEPLGNWHGIRWCILRSSIRPFVQPNHQG